MIAPLQEGTFTVDESKVFIPFNPLTDQLKDRPASLVVEIVPFLITTGNDVIVIDPGLGLQLPDRSFQIHENLGKHGISPEQVTKVLLSHLHKDHTGGICYGKDNAFNLMFPNATYYAQEKEMEYAFSKKNSPSF